MRQGFVFGFVFLGTASSLDGSCPEMYDNTRFVFHSAPRHGTRQVVRLAYDSQDRKEVALKFSDTVPGNKLIARDHASYERELPHARRELQVASKLIHPRATISTYFWIKYELSTNLVLTQVLKVTSDSLLIVVSTALVVVGVLLLVP